MVSLMRIWLSKNSDVPLREQLATQILLGIVSEDLKPGQKLSVIEKDGHIELRPILTPEQLVGFLKGETPLEFEREADREF